MSREDEPIPLATDSGEVEPGVDTGDVGQECQTVELPDSYADILKYRYGIVNIAGVERSLAELSNKGKFMIAWVVGMTKELCEDVVQANVPMSLLIPAQDFLLALSAQQSLQGSVAASSDILPCNRAQHPRSQHESMVEWHRLTLGFQNEAGRQETVTNFVVRYRERAAIDVEWEVVVPNMTTVAQIMRCRWGPDKVELARELMRRGIPFRTGLLSATETSTVRREFRYGLSTKAFGYNFIKADYALYEEECQLVLQEHGLKALLKGGILWRLAIEMMEIPCIQFGPLTIPDSGWCGHLEGGVYIAGEELSQRDADVLVGLYRVHNSTLWTFLPCKKV